MDFTKRLRPGVLRGEITCSIRIWQRPKRQGRQSLPEHGSGADRSRLDRADRACGRHARAGARIRVQRRRRPAEDREARQRHERVPGAVPLRSCLDEGTAPPARKSPSGEKQRKRVAKIVEGFPEAEAKPEGRHMSLQVRKKNFGWFLVDHHADGRVAHQLQGICTDPRHAEESGAGAFPLCRSISATRAGSGCGSTCPRLDWALVELTLREAYARVAPKKLALSQRVIHAL